MDDRQGENPDRTDIAHAAAQAGTPVATGKIAVQGQWSTLREYLSGYWEKFIQWGGREQILTLLALTAVLAEFFFARSVFVPILIFAVLVVIFLVALDSKTWLGKYIPPRMVLLIYPAALASLNPSSTVLVFAFAVVLTLEALVRKPFDSLPSEPAANLPGMSVLPRSGMARLQRVLFCGLVALQALLTIAVMVVAPDVVELIIVMVGFLLAIVGAVRAKQYRLRHHRMVQAKHVELARLQPRFYVHWDGPDDGLYQVAMWTDYLRRTGLPFAVIVRKGRTVVPMAEKTGVPVVHMGDMEDVDRSIVPSLQAVVYVNTTLKNAHYIRFTELNQIQINHGDSDKPASVSPMFRMFNVNFVAGQAAIDRFEHFGVHMPRELIKAVGRPQVESVLQARSGATVETILYAPTWAGFFDDSDFSSLRVGPELIRRLLDGGYRVIFRPHAFTSRNKELQQKSDEIKTMLERDREVNGRQHVFGVEAETGMEIFDCFNSSDAMIADISSIVTDYLFSEKPVALVAANTSIEIFRESFPISQRLPVIDGELKNAGDIIEDMTGDDAAGDARRDVKTYYLGEFDAEGYADNFVQALKDAVATSQNTAVS